MKGVALGLLALVVLAGCVKSVSKLASEFCEEKGLSYGFEKGTCYKVSGDGNLTFERKICVVNDDRGKESFYLESNAGC